MDRRTRSVLNKSQTKIKTLKEITKRDKSKKFNIPLLINYSDGTNSNMIESDKIGDLTSSSSGSGAVWGYSSEANADKVHTGIDALVDDVVALSNKLNLIIRALKSEGIIR